MITAGPLYRKSPSSFGHFAAAGRPTEAFLICSDALQVVYVGKGLATLLQLRPEGSSRDSGLLRLLSRCAALNAASRATIMSSLSGADASRRGDFSHVLGAATDRQAIHLQIQRVGDAHWMLSFEDPHMRKETGDNVIHLTLTDPLTGLGNRIRFRQSLTRSLGESSSTCGRVALLLIDLDRFKIVNDTLGHPIGDLLLRKVGERLCTVIRQTDMLARLGGDEFAIWIPSAPDGGALARLAGRIVDLLGRTFLLEGLQVNIGASVGIAVSPQDGADYETFMKSADLALYSAKAMGRGAFHFFNPAMERTARK